MLPRRPGEGRRSAQPNKLLLAFAIIIIPWLQLAYAQQQQQQLNVARPPAAHAAIHHADDAAKIAHEQGPKILGTAVDAVTGGRSRQTPAVLPGNAPRRSPSRNNNNNNRHQKPRHQTENLNVKPDDESAIATLAPADAVRAPHPPRHLRPSSSIPAAGLSSPQSARSLEDWEVEDFVLLATIDGDLYASHRRTGKQLWHLEVDQPMVETTHFRVNNSILDDDYSPIDHYIWAVEPTQDGGVFVWTPDSDAGIIHASFTMKQLVEDLSPHTPDDEPGLVYTGDKKSTMVTLDAATGRVLKWFGSSGSHVNEAESCLQPNTFEGQDEECSSTGTITIGRVEYTVGIQRRDGRPVATLKYSEWVPNNFDNDLNQQYRTSLDSRYITTQHDGKVYGFDQSRPEEPTPLFSHKFASPVARVFDVCRPWDAVSGSNPQLIVLSQPSMPTGDEEVLEMRRNSIFLNQTEGGSWYAMSGSVYPLIIHAPQAKISHKEWWDFAPSWETIEQSRLNSALVGTHLLDTPPTRPQTIPRLPGPQPENGGDGDPNNSQLPKTETETEEPTIVAKVKALPKSAADSVVEFVTNPVLVIIFIVALIYNEKKLRRSYHRMRTKGFLKELNEFFLPEPIPEPIEEKKTIPEKKKDTLPPPSPPPKEREEAKPANITPPPSEDGRQSQSPSENTAEDAKAKATAEPIGDLDATPKAKEEEQLDNRSESRTSDGSGSSPDTPATPVPEKKKKAHRGRRGGVKHKKNKATESSQSQNDERDDATVEEAIKNAKKLGDRPSLEPDVMTIANDMQAVTGPIIRMGNIEVDTELQLGTGSNGTLVFAGKFDGRDVAVKRMLIQFYDIASQETRLLRESDDHPNVIRYYSQQMQDGFLYIALERCAASLAEVVEKPHAYRELANAGKMDLPNVLYQITNGISHLHNLRIVHRDLKPQNILVNMGKGGKPRMLVSDFGLCKKLEGGQSSFGATTGRAAGTSGWRAPELLLDDDARETSMVDASTHSGSGSVLVNDGGLPSGRRATRAIDIFSLGLVFFYVLTNGSHPFDCGDRYMREVNIRKGSYNLKLLDVLGDFAYEAKDLIASMLDAEPRRRPNAREVMSHPFFWSPKKRLAFLCDVSDHFEKEPRDPPSPALVELERHATAAIQGDFLKLLPREFVDSLGKQRKYTGTRMLDLLRALRNKKNHYEDMSESLRRTVGPLPEGYLSFWTLRFPQLLLVCWNVVYNVQWEETDRFREYYQPAGL